jgi:hypothetical protein
MFFIFFYGHIAFEVDRPYGRAKQPLPTTATMLRATEVNDIAPPPENTNMARDRVLAKAAEAVDKYVDKAAAEEPWGADLLAVALEEAHKEADAAAAVARVNAARPSDLLATISPRGYVDVAAQQPRPKMDGAAVARALLTKSRVYDPEFDAAHKVIRQ